jgi:hypothetical protein
MKWIGTGGSYLALVAQPAVACRTGSVVEAVDPVGAVVDAVEPLGAAVEAIEPVDAETGDVRDEVVCASHG